ncbi:MAG: TonB-dependent receptor, partial [Candidatus Electrothrix sp. MAN1_4]|nr:TonB-dependent receptor [Candidatus Electrothrix sp. MAN1_4]
EASAAKESLSGPTLKKLGHNVEVITGEELEAAGFVDLSDALASIVPGIQYSNNQGRGGYNQVRIHGTNEILWLLDGIRVGAIHGSYNVNWSYSLSVHMIDRIEVLEGGESLFYGTGARGGVINIITKEITEEASGQFGTAFGEDKYREVYGHATQTFDGHGLMAFASQESYEGYQVVDDDVYADLGNDYKDRNSGFDRFTGGVKYRKEFDLVGLRSVLNAQYRRHTGYFDYPNPHQRSSRFDWNQDVSSLQWEHDVNNNFSYHMTAYYHRWWADITQQNADGSYFLNYDPVECDDLGLNLNTSTRWGDGHEIVSGLDYRTYWGSFEWFYGHDYDRVSDYALFASYRPYLSFSPDTKLAMSGRYTMTSDDANSFVWDVSAKTPITKNSFIRGSVRTDFSLPTLGQLSGDYVWGSNIFIANPDLEPEESLNLQFGVGGQWQSFNIYAGYFRNEVENLIQNQLIDSTGGINTSTYRNVEGETKIDGVEASLGIGPFNGFSFDLTACWTNAEDGDTGEQLEQIAEFNSTGTLKYRYKTGRFGGDLSTSYTGDIYERGLGTFDDVEYGDYFVTDLTAFVTLGNDMKHKVTLRTENIFDEGYANGYAVSSNVLYKRNGLGRNVMLGYTYTF